MRGVFLAILCVLMPFASASQAVASPTKVAFSGAERPGTIVVHTGERRLYLVLGNGNALRYSVGVGRPEHQWSGRTQISGKFLRPNWAPPARIRQDAPGLPTLVVGGSPSNPMGEAALTLAGGSYAIHGTNRPDSIGGPVSYGCIRMLNEDVLDLFARVRVGSRVVVRP